MYTREELSLCSDSTEWGMWPVLPLRRRSSLDRSITDLQMTDLGFLFHNQGPVVYLGNIYMIPRGASGAPVLKRLRREEFSSMDSLLREWKVD